MLINMKNNIEEISKLCDTIKKFCEDNKISDEKYHDIVLILDELVTNVINYAYPEGGDHTFTVDIHKEENDEMISITLADDGIPFDPLARDKPDTESSLEEREIGGLGIFIVKQLSEAVEYTRVDKKNQLDIKVAVANKENQEEPKT